MISITQCKYILSLSELNNFQKAAEANFVTQPTLSMQLKKAEEKLGNKLFDRDRNPLELTQFGIAVLPYFRNIVESELALSDFISKENGNHLETLRIGIIPTIGSYLVPKLFEFAKQNLPDVQLLFSEYTSELLLEAIETRKVDMGIMAGPVSNSNFNQQILFEEELFIYAPHHEGNTIDNVKLSKMQPWLLSKGNCLRTQMLNFCEIEKNLKSQWNYEGGNMDIVMRMVDSEGGFTVIPEYHIALTDRKKINFKTLENEHPGRSVISIQLSSNRKKARLTKIIKHAQICMSVHREYQLNILNWK